MTVDTQLLICDIQRLIPENWHITINTWHTTFFRPFLSVLVLVPLSTNIERLKCKKNVQSYGILFTNQKKSFFPIKAPYVYQITNWELRSQMCPPPSPPSQQTNFTELLVHIISILGQPKGPLWQTIRTEDTETH